MGIEETKVLLTSARKQIVVNRLKPDVRISYNEEGVKECVA